VSYYDAAQQALHQWGAWARRPQFWVNLRGHGMFGLLPMPKQSRGMPEIRLDPFARRIHEQVMMLPDLEAGILYAYYVRGVAWDQRPDAFREHGVGRRRFYELLRAASISAYNRARA
jgi:hypothetical protein